MELSDAARKVLEKRYLLKDESGKVVETPEEMFRRVARAVAVAEDKYGDDPEEWASCYYEMMASLAWLPNSPTLMNAGTAHPMLSACFVLPVEDDMSSIFTAVKDAALIHQSGGRC